MSKGGRRWRDEAIRQGGRLDALRELESWVHWFGVRSGSLLDEIRRMQSDAVAALRAPDSGPETSKKAARELTVRVGTLRHRALRCYDGRDLTDEECGIVAEYPRMWPRCSELRTMGLIEPTGELRVCERTGMACDVNRITDAGRSALRAMEVVAP